MRPFITVESFELCLDLFLTAGYTKAGSHSVELYDVDTDSWAIKPNNPYFPGGFYSNPIVYLDNSFFMFGGHETWNNSGSSELITSFSLATDSWIKRGEMLMGRRSAGVLWTGDSFLVVGGADSNGVQSGHKSEKCVFVDEYQLQCSYQEPTTPETLTTINGAIVHLFPVPSDYCLL